MKQTEEIIDKQERRAQLLAEAEKLRLEMEALASKIRDLVLTQAPVQLLGYLLAQFHMANMFSADEDQRPDKTVIQKFQLALEYVHAVWSCHTNLADESTPLDEAVTAELFETLDQMEAATMMYCMASSAPDLNSDHGRQSAETEFQAKSTWALIRGHRYQVLRGSSSPTFSSRTPTRCAKLMAWSPMTSPMEYRILQTPSAPDSATLRSACSNVWSKPTNW